MSLQYRQSPLRYNNDTTDDNDITLTNVQEEVLPLIQLMIMMIMMIIEGYDDNDLTNKDHFNSSVDDNDDNCSNIPINDEYEGHCDIPINEDSQLVPSMACLKRRIVVGSLVSLAPILSSNLVILDFARCNFDDVGVSKLFTKNTELILELRKVTLRDRF